MAPPGIHYCTKRAVLERLHGLSVRLNNHSAVFDAARSNATRRQVDMPILCFGVFRAWLGVRLDFRSDRLCCFVQSTDRRRLAWTNSFRRAASLVSDPKHQPCAT